MKSNWLGHAAVFCALLLTAGNAEGNTGGLAPSVAVDMHGGFKTDEDSTASDRFDIREAEFSLAAPVDHLFDGCLSIAAHPEDGAQLFELHEAWLSTSKLLPGVQMKAGQFFLGVGRLNRVHRHDWPFMSAPEVQQRFFGSEGVIDTGGEVAYLTPLPFFLELTLGVTNGWVWGHSHNEGEKPRKPTVYGRIATSSEVLGAEYVLAGNVLTRTAADGVETRLFGSDFVAKRKAGARNLLLVQSEIWRRYTKAPAVERTIEQGSYLFVGHDLQGGLGLGLRMDYFTDLTLKDALGDHVPNSVTGIAPQLSYGPSEFSRVRTGLHLHEIKQDADNRRFNRVFELQFVYLLGAHPAHDF